ncbi:YfeC-like transcriptional regulator [Enterobacter asburiae]
MSPGIFEPMKSMTQPEQWRLAAFFKGQGIHGFLTRVGLTE